MSWPVMTTFLSTSFSHCPWYKGERPSREEEILRWARYIILLLFFVFLTRRKNIIIKMIIPREVSLWPSVTFSHLEIVLFSLFLKSFLSVRGQEEL